MDDQSSGLLDIRSGNGLVNDAIERREQAADTIHVLGVGLKHAIWLSQHLF